MRMLVFDPASAKSGIKFLSRGCIPFFFNPKAAICKGIFRSLSPKEIQITEE
jgi:hypothetical protein